MPHPHPSSLRPETLLVHGGTERSAWGETSEGLFLTQGYVYSSMEEAEARFKGEAPGHLYSRYSNPTVAMFEERVALLEGAECALATASGMAAVTAALLGVVRAGDHVVASSVLFGSCGYIITELLPRFGVETTLVAGDDLAAWQAAVRPQTRAFFLESPANPTTALVDIAEVAALAKDVGAKVVIDNAMATPVLQRPLALGADCVVYSSTKHMDGQGRCLGGIILASKDFIDAHIRQIHRHTGPALSPFNAWVMLKGLETLSLRVERQIATAHELAARLACHPRVSKVLYPFREDHPQVHLARRQMRGGGTVFSFVLDGGKEAAFRFGRALQLVLISNNFGDAKSIITHPATTTHHRYSPEARAAMGVDDGLLRFSAGLEHVEDLAADLLQALDTL